VPSGLFTPRRIGIGVLCLAAFAACCGLAWWQWSRFESASGTFQNLGYVLQWPLFGVFPAFMVWRIWKLRRQAAEQDAQNIQNTQNTANTGTSRAEWGRAPVSEVPAPRPRRVPAYDPAEEPDDELAAYNRYLAELHARDQQRDS